MKKYFAVLSLLTALFLFFACKKNSEDVTSAEVPVAPGPPATVEAVDLGLPSGLKWASCNLGASSPEEYGDYYAWGEVIPYYAEGHSLDNPCTIWKDRPEHPITGYDNSSYKWCYQGDGKKLTKYCSSANPDYWYGEGDLDNKTSLKDYNYEDDVARAEWGGTWRIPTYDDFQELIDNCTFAWTTINGKYGRKFTSAIPGYKDKWIFLPAAGYRIGVIMDYVDVLGYYWSSNIASGDSDYAYVLYNNSTVVKASGVSSRCYGFPLRPVRE